MQHARPKPGERVAIIGAGIAGLAAAHLLHDKYQLTVFEAAGYAGGHTNTIDVQAPDGTIAVDTGFIVYNETNYPLFTSLLSKLGVRTQPTNMSFGVSCDRTGFEYNGSSLNQLFARRRNAFSPRFYSMTVDILRFHRLTQPDVFDVSDDLSVADYVATRRLGDAFYNLYLLPIGASIWSSPADTFAQYPIRFVVDFLRNHGMLQLKHRPQWRVIQGGSARYVERLTAPLMGQLRLNTPVLAVRRAYNTVSITTAQEQLQFDHVIFATHSDQALAMLPDSSPIEREILGKLRFQENIATLHTDHTLLPRTRRAWGGWNYRISHDPSRPVSITYNMNILQSLDSEKTYCVTLNGEDMIDPARKIQTIRYEHPVYSSQSQPYRQRHAELIGPNRTSFCGAYWGNGFHEDGVRSAFDVASLFEGAR